jgi:hypothetical protein
VPPPSRRLDLPPAVRNLTPPGIQGYLGDVKGRVLTAVTGVLLAAGLIVLPAFAGANKRFCYPGFTVPAVTIPAVTIPAVTIPAVTIPAVTIPRTCFAGTCYPAQHIPAQYIPSQHIAGQHIAAQQIPAQHIAGMCFNLPSTFAPRHTTVRTSNYRAIDRGFSPRLSSSYWGNTGVSVSYPNVSSSGFGGYNAAGFPKNQYVRPYLRRDGTFVNGYWRNSPTDGLPTCRIIRC